MVKLFCHPRVFKALAKRPHKNVRVTINGCTFTGRQLVYGKMPISPVYLQSAFLPVHGMMFDDGRTIK